MRVLETRDAVVDQEASTGGSHRQTHLKMNLAAGERRTTKWDHADLRIGCRGKSWGTHAQPSGQIRKQITGGLATVEQAVELGRQALQHGVGQGRRSGEQIGIRAEPAARGLQATPHPLQLRHPGSQHGRQQGELVNGGGRSRLGHAREQLPGQGAPILLMRSVLGLRCNGRGENLVKLQPGKTESVCQAASQM